LVTNDIRQHVANRQRQGLGSASLHLQVNCQQCGVFITIQSRFTRSSRIARTQQH